MTPLFVALLLAQAPARDAPPPIGTAVIRGRVTVDGAERPLSRVEARASCPPLRVNKAVLTDASGRYEIGELPACRYTVGFVRVNYVRANFGQRRPLGPGAAIDVGDGQVVTRVDAVLQRAGVVSGRVLDEYGDPITGVQVMPMRYAPPVNGERRLQNAGMTGITNDLGEYRIYGLSPGRFFIAAMPRSSGSGGDTDRAYLPTYYPGTGRVAEAQRIVVGTGQAIAGINLSLLPVMPVRISGIALDSRGRPMAGANVDLSQRVGSGGMYGTSYGQVRPDGSFTIGGVAPGDYAIQISLTGAPDEIAATDISVSSDVTDLQITAATLSTVRGRVVFEAGVKPPPAGTLRVTITHPGALSARSGSDVPKADGTFELKTSGGHARIVAGVSAGPQWNMKRVLGPDGSDVTDSGFEVPVGGAADGVVVELTTTLPEVSGTVVDAAGASVRDCVVLLFAQDPLRWSTESRFFGIGRPDQDNVFRARVPAGDYFAAAFELDDPMVALNDPDILRQLRERATRISVGDGEKKTLSLALSEPPVF